MKWDGALKEIWRRDGCGPSAAVSFQDGFLITCYDSNEFVHVSMEGDTLAVVTQDTESNGFVGPNDFAADGSGGAWMTTSGPWDSKPIEGAIYYIGPDLSATRVADD